MTASPAPHVPSAVEGGVTCMRLDRPEEPNAPMLPIIDPSGR